jgi:hypothetical protein
MLSDIVWSDCCAQALRLKAEQQADAITTNANLFILFSYGENPRMFERTGLKV